MRGDHDTPTSFWYSIDLVELIEADHPLSGFKRMVDEALRGMDKDFRKAYSDRGRRSVAPERLLKALLLQALYSIRSERELCRRLKTDLLFRWFLAMSPDEEVFVPTVFTHKRERLAEHRLTSRFFGGVVKHAQAAGLASDEQFTVDGSPIQSHASLKSLKRIAREAADDGDGGRQRPPVARRRDATQPQRERRLPRAKTRSSIWSGCGDCWPRRAQPRRPSDPKPRIAERTDRRTADSATRGHVLRISKLRNRRERSGNP